MRLLTILTLLCLSLTGYADHHGEKAKFESPSDVSSIGFLPTALQTGPNHTVSSMAVSNGFQNVYTISSKFGEFEATGLAALKTRVAEVDAMAYLEALSRADVFVGALKDAGVETAGAIAGVFTSPVTTVKGIPGGVDRVFAGARRGFGLTKRLFQGKSDSATIDPKDFREMNYLVGNSERQWASELKTDPYTTNMKLREMVSSMSVVEFIGGLPIDIALPMGAGLAVGVLGDETEVYLQSAELLEQKNRSCLEEFNVTAADIEAFITASYLTPTTQTGFCNTLVRLDDIESIDKLPALLAKTESFEASHFLLQTINLLAWYNAEINEVTEIISDDGLPYGTTDDGTVLAMLPADNLLWTDLVESRMSDIKSDKTKTLWVLGVPSKLASEQLTKSGWKVMTTANTPSLDALYKAGTTASKAE
ncbi:MAG: hypothetical protein ACJAR0_000178 [Candidatus Azotimanducaceae bacterium]|jgi:hypothetical protein